MSATEAKQHLRAARHALLRAMDHIDSEGSLEQLDQILLVADGHVAAVHCAADDPWDVPRGVGRCS